MPAYRFAVIVASAPLSQDEILDITDALGTAGCTDASIRGHAAGIELLFERSADSLQAAIASAQHDHRPAIGWSDEIGRGKVFEMNAIEPRQAAGRADPQIAVPGLG